LVEVAEVGMMQLAAFRALVRRLAGAVPEEYLDGIAAVDVSPRTVPHPQLPDVYTLGECIPVHGDTDEVLSRVVLYYGSFRALARGEPDFDWEGEAHETLLHELRHHLEWRAADEGLERYDWAVEQNHRRIDGDPFDPLFFQVGERVEERIFRVEDDVFIDRVVRARPDRVELVWRGRRYSAPVGAGPLPAFVALDGLDEPPSGDVFVVFRRRPKLRDLFRPPAVPSIERAHVDPIA
jgi:hypothetical protein